MWINNSTYRFLASLLSVFTSSLSFIFLFAFVPSIICPSFRSVLSCFFTCCHRFSFQCWFLPLSIHFTVRHHQPTQYQLWAYVCSTALGKYHTDYLVLMELAWKTVSYSRNYVLKVCGRSIILTAVGTLRILAWFILICFIRKMFLSKMTHIFHFVDM